KIGYATNYYDLSSFEVTPNHLEFLKHLEVKRFDNEKNFMLLLQKGDELLNYEEAVKKMPEAILKIEEGGNHSFVGIERYFDEIESFFSSNK
ncbi:MAG: YqiA/YcfP family alpha/beta fold hydrolase, partial [Arcobacteraceae bacterium]